MENADQKNDLLKGIQKVMEKSIEANTRIMTETSKTFTQLLSKKTEFSDLQKLNTEVFNHTISSFMEINMKYAESLIDLGLQLSKDMSSFVESLDQKKENETAKTENVKAAPQKSELRISGQAGETAIANFVLNSSADVTQKGSFKASRCVSDETSKPTNIRLKFSPKSFEIPPGQKADIEITAQIPKSSKAGSYRSHVIITGFENTEFDVVVYVDESSKQKV